MKDNHQKCEEKCKNSCCESKKELEIDNAFVLPFLISLLSSFGTYKSKPDDFVFEPLLNKLILRIEMLEEEVTKLKKFL